MSSSTVHRSNFYLQNFSVEPYSLSSESLYLTVFRLSPTLILPHGRGRATVYINRLKSINKLSESTTVERQEVDGLYPTSKEVGIRPSFLLNTIIIYNCILYIIMGILMKFNIWIFFYSFNISFLLTGIGYHFLSSYWKALFVFQSELIFFSWIFFILLNLIVYGICYVSMNSCALKDIFPE